MQMVKEIGSCCNEYNAANSCMLNGLIGTPKWLKIFSHFKVKYSYAKVFFGGVKWSRCLASGTV